MDTKKIEAAVAQIIEAVGEDGSREGLQETPQRIAKMYQEIFAGLGDSERTGRAAEGPEATDVSGESSRAMPQPLPEEAAAAGSLLAALASCTMPAPSVPPSWASMRRNAPSDRETE